MYKILLLTSSYPSNTGTDTRSFMSDLAYVLSCHYRVSVLCPHQAGLPYREERNGLTIIRFPYWFPSSGEQLNKAGGLLSSIAESPLVSIQIIPFCICQFFMTWRIMRREHIDIIHSHWLIPQGLVAGILHFFTGVPHISSVHGTDIHLISSHRIMHPVLRFIAHSSQCITANSSHTAKLLSAIVKAEECKIQVLPMGIHASEYDRPNSKNLTWDRNKKVILFVGRLIRWKGVQTLIISMKEVKRVWPESRLVIIGEGPMREELEEVAAGNQVSSSVIFLGRQEKEVLLSYYKNSDVFVLPSIVYQDQTEGLGVVLLEAMASGIPVIGSNTGGIPDIITDGVNGTLVPPGNPDALAEAIINIFSDRELADNFRKAGIKTVQERFSWDGIVKQFIKIYTELLPDEIS